MPYIKPHSLYLPTEHRRTVISQMQHHQLHSKAMVEPHCGVMSADQTCWWQPSAFSLWWCS